MYLKFLTFLATLGAHAGEVIALLQAAFDLYNKIFPQARGLMAASVTDHVSGQTFSAEILDAEAKVRDLATAHNFGAVPGDRGVFDIIAQVRTLYAWLESHGVVALFMLLFSRPQV